ARRRQCAVRVRRDGRRWHRRRGHALRLRARHRGGRVRGRPRARGAAGRPGSGPLARDRQFPARVHRRHAVLHRRRRRGAPVPGRSHQRAGLQSRLSMDDSATPAAPEPMSQRALAAVRRHPWLALLCVLATAIALLVAFWDWNWFKGPIERQVEARTGRDFQIRGSLDVDLGWTTTVTAGDVRFGNAEWAGDEDMAEAERVAIDIAVKPLFARRVRIPLVRLHRPVLRLQKGEQGGNWDFLPEDDDG